MYQAAFCRKSTLICKNRHSSTKIPRENFIGAEFITLYIMRGANFILELASRVIYLERIIRILGARRADTKEMIAISAKGVAGCSTGAKVLSWIGEARITGWWNDGRG